MDPKQRQASSEKLIGQNVNNSMDFKKKPKKRRSYDQSDQFEQLMEPHPKGNLNDSEVQQQEEGLSDDQRDRQREKVIKADLNSQNLKKTAEKKMVVGTGFSMDVTEFFQFKKKQLRSGQEASIFEQISGSRIAWLILLYSVTTGAMIPGWIMNIPANKLIRISWRFMMQVFMVIPFVLYEYRTGSEKVREKYSLKYIFKKENFIKPFASSLATSMWFTLILSGFEWTSVSHSLVLGSLANFFLSLGRSWRKSSHDLEAGGQMLVLGGLILVVWDSITFGVDDYSSHDFDFKNKFFLRRQWYQRLGYDFLAFFVSFLMSQFSKFTSDLGSYYPPFLSMFMVNVLITINMSLSSYFINGSNFSFHTYWGIWSLFSNQHFAGFMYMAIILSLGQIVSLVMITRMFPDPIIPALAMTLQPFIATLLVQVSGIQIIPGNFSIIGYVFIVPGICLILVGQCLYQRITARVIQDQYRQKDLKKQLQELQARKKTREAKRKQKQQNYKVMLRQVSQSSSKLSRKGSA